VRSGGQGARELSRCAGAAACVRACMRACVHVVLVALLARRRVASRFSTSPARAFQELTDSGPQYGVHQHTFCKGFCKACKRFG
jgi:hypothetical protein